MKQEQDSEDTTRLRMEFTIDDDSEEHDMMRRYPIQKEVTKTKEVK